MPIVTIRDLYIIDLTELYDAERQILCELPLLAAAATADELRDAFDEHYRHTLSHLDRLERIFRDLDERPRGAGSRSLRLLVEDGRERNALLDRGPLLDAALLAVAQRIAHYEIGAYRSAHTYAARLADHRGVGPLSVGLLEETLTEEEWMAGRLTALAAAGAAPAARHPAQLPVAGPVATIPVAEPFVDGAGAPALVVRPVTLTPL